MTLDLLHELFARTFLLHVITGCYHAQVYVESFFCLILLT
ncbi:hypothetical protein LDFHOB_00895 [Candidatus Electronema aureum]